MNFKAIQNVVVINRLKVEIKIISSTPKGRNYCWSQKKVYKKHLFAFLGQGFHNQIIHCKNELGNFFHLVFCEC